MTVVIKYTIEQTDLASKQSLEDAAAFKEAKGVIGWVDSISLSSLAEGEVSHPPVASPCPCFK